MMVMGTYANLYAMEEINTSPPHLDRIQLSPIDKVMESKPIINKMKDKYVIDIKKGKSKFFFTLIPNPHFRIPTWGFPKWVV